MKRIISILLAFLFLLAGCGLISEQVVKDYLTSVIKGGNHDAYLQHNSQYATIDDSAISDFVVNDFEILRTEHVKDDLLGDGSLYHEYDLVIVDVVFQSQAGSPLIKTKRFHVEDGEITWIE